MNNKGFHLYSNKITTFLNTNHPTPTPGENDAYVQSLRKCRVLMKRNSVILYGMMNYFPLRNSFQTMFTSVNKQKDLVHAVLMHVKSNKVTDEYASSIKGFITTIQKRNLYIWTIIKENINLTPYALFFEEVGYDKITTRCVVLDEHIDDFFVELYQEATAYIEQNKDRVEEHMESVQPLINALWNERKTISDKAKEEKEKRKALKREEHQTQKEIFKEMKQERSREVRWQKELQTTLKHLDRGYY